MHPWILCSGPWCAPSAPLVYDLGARLEHPGAAFVHAWSTPGRALVHPRNTPGYSVLVPGARRCTPGYSVLVPGATLGATPVHAWNTPLRPLCTPGAPWCSLGYSALVPGAAFVRPSGYSVLVLSATLGAPLDTLFWSSAQRLVRPGTPPDTLFRSPVRPEHREPHFRLGEGKLQPHLGTWNAPSKSVQSLIPHFGPDLGNENPIPT